MSSPSSHHLRVVTYMCPSHPVELYELVVELLEEQLGCTASLHYESRFPGPPPSRPDPFANDQVDLAFMTAGAYMGLRDAGARSAQLVPATPVFDHPNNRDSRPGYYSDIIVHADKMTHNVSTLLDLRGCTFAYSDKESLSSSKIVLKTLREKGENASFFGSQLRSGSHLASALMVLGKQADWAAVDASALPHARARMPGGGADVVTLETLGRLPPYPVLVNARLPESLKKSIAGTLLEATQAPAWRRRFAALGVRGWQTNSDAGYSGPAAQVRAVAADKLNVRYY